MDEKKYRLVKAISFVVSAFALVFFVCAYIHDKRYEVSSYEGVVVITDKWEKDATMIFPSKASNYWERLRENSKQVNAVDW